MKEPHKKREQDTSLEEQFGNVLQELRKEKGVSQEELGLESGYHRTYYKAGRCNVFLSFFQLLIVSHVKDNMPKP